MSDSEKKRSPEVELHFGNFKVRLQETVSVIVALIGVIAGIATLLVGSRERKLTDGADVRIKELVESVAAKNASALSNQFVVIDQRIHQLDAQLNTLTNITTEARLLAKLQDVDLRLAQIDERLMKMERAVLQDPAKALEMPLLRKDFEHLKASYEADALSIKNEVSRIYDLNKWFIGLMFSMALGIIGLAVTNFIKSSKKNDS